MCRPPKFQLHDMAGALTVFARDGYMRASVDAIAAEAGVSTRTIYNHFQDKAQLFQTVIQESATRVAEAQIAIIADTCARSPTWRPTSSSSAGAG